MTIYVPTVLGENAAKHINAGLYAETAHIRRTTQDLASQEAVLHDISRKGSQGLGAATAIAQALAMRRIYRAQRDAEQIIREAYTDSAREIVGSSTRFKESGFLSADVIEHAENVTRLEAELELAEKGREAVSVEKEEALQRAVEAARQPNPEAVRVAESQLNAARAAFEETPPIKELRAQLELAENGRPVNPREVARLRNELLAARTPSPNPEAVKAAEDALKEALKKADGSSRVVSLKNELSTEVKKISDAGLRKQINNIRTKLTNARKAGIDTRPLVQELESVVATLPEETRARILDLDKRISYAYSTEEVRTATRALEALRRSPADPELVARLSSELEAAQKGVAPNPTEATRLRGEIERLAAENADIQSAKQNLAVVKRTPADSAELTRAEAALHEARKGYIPADPERARTLRRELRIAQKDFQTAFEGCSLKSMSDNDLLKAMSRLAVAEGDEGLQLAAKAALKVSTSAEGVILRKYYDELIRKGVSESEAIKMCAERTVMENRLASQRGTISNCRTVLTTDGNYPVQQIMRTKEGNLLRLFESPEMERRMKAVAENPPKNGYLSRLVASGKTQLKRAFREGTRGANSLAFLTMVAIVLDVNHVPYSDDIAKGVQKIAGIAEGTGKQGGIKIQRLDGRYKNPATQQELITRAMIKLQEKDPTGYRSSQDYQFFEMLLRDYNGDYGAYVVQNMPYKGVNWQGKIDDGKDLPEWLSYLDDDNVEKSIVYWWDLEQNALISENANQRFFSALEPVVNPNNRNSPQLTPATHAAATQPQSTERVPAPNVPVQPQAPTEDEALDFAENVNFGLSYLLQESSTLRSSLAASCLTAQESPARSTLQTHAQEFVETETVSESHTSGKTMV